MARSELQEKRKKKKKRGTKEEISFSSIPLTWNKIFHLILGFFFTVLRNTSLYILIYSNFLYIKMSFQNQQSRGFVLETLNLGGKKIPCFLREGISNKIISQIQHPLVSSSSRLWPLLLKNSLICFLVFCFKCS